MPDAPSWVATIPDVLEGIKADKREWYGRKDIETLLEVKPRRAQEILAAAGAVMDGKAFLLSRSNLVQYLEVIGRDVLAQEQRRRARFAQKLNKVAEQWVPPLLVELKNSEVRQLQRKGLEALPPGITLEPGRITVSGFSTGEESLQLLMALALAIRGDQAEFEKRVTKA